MEPDTGYSHLICGLSGAGKTTLARSVAGRLGFDFVDFADLILRELPEIPIGSDHDRILTVAPPDLVEAIDRARQECLLTVQRGARVILETHLGAHVRGLGYRLTRPRVLRSRRTRSITVVMPDIGTLRDFKRFRGARRDTEAREDREYEWDRLVLLNDASVSAAVLGIPVLIEENRFGELEAAVARICTFIMSVDSLGHPATPRSIPVR